jgi:hypothetical protein
MTYIGLQYHNRTGIAARQKDTTQSYVWDMIRTWIVHFESS